MSFNDEQLADEKSIANMKLKYASIKENKMVKALQESSSTKCNLEIARKIKRTNKYLSFLNEIGDKDISFYVNELKSINDLELKKLREIYEELNEIDFDNPELTKRPQNIYELNKNLAENELELLSELFDLFFKEANASNKTMLEKMIKRKIEALKIMFLNPKLNIQIW